MKRVRAHSVGLVFASLLAAWHLIWSLLVAVGGAQLLLDWIFRLHMIEPVYRVSGFDPVMAVSLVLVTAAFGYAGGFIAGSVWNRFGPVDSVG